MLAFIDWIKVLRLLRLYRNLLVCEIDGTYIEQKKNKQKIKKEGKEKVKEFKMLQ